MSPHQPDGQAWPRDGHLDPSQVEAEARRPLSLYVHVPFCAVRCGYCDFNTYTVGFGQGASPENYETSAEAELRMAASLLERAGMPPRELSTVFFGGGTPTLLHTRQLGEILETARQLFGLVPGAETSVEANPESVDTAALEQLKKAGFTRVSFGMQSAVPHVLRTLDRTHRPEKLPPLVRAARDVGLDVSVDLIYGAPGESLDDWRRSLDAALEMTPDHISAYALVIEEGTKMGAQVARGELPVPDPDDEATKYEMADRVLGNAGYAWYEISNFAKREADEEGRVATELRHASQHNLAYWRDWDWWGIGPGAHSHVGRMRWWNVKHPRAYAERLAQGWSPAHEGEDLDADTRELERVLLGIRTAEGILPPEGTSSEVLTSLAADGLINAESARGGRAVLTLRGRLLADYVTRVLTGMEEPR